MLQIHSLAVWILMHTHGRVIAIGMNALVVLRKVVAHGEVLPHAYLVLHLGVWVDALHLRIRDGLVLNGVLLSVIEVLDTLLMRLH
jgi:hypothetical protein